MSDGSIVNGSPPGASLDVSTPFDALPHASFTPDGGSVIYIPLEEYEKDGKGRDHVHVFPHSPGGLPEKLGVELYTISIKAAFDYGFQGIYPGNYPDAIDNLEQAFETQVSGALMCPTFRQPMRAYCLNWKRTFKARLRSGESVTLVFRQDQTIDSKFSQTRTFTIDNGNAILQAYAVDLPPDSTGASLFQSIDDLVNSIVGLQESVQADGMLLSAKIQRLQLLCSELDSSASQVAVSPGQTLDMPAQWQILDALHDLWFAAIQQRNTLAQSNDVPLQFYIVPSLMTLAQLSTAIFGDATHGDDIMALNPIDDVYNIPSPTRIAYYDPNAQGS